MTQKIQINLFYHLIWVLMYLNITNMAIYFWGKMITNVDAINLCPLLPLNITQVPFLSQALYSNQSFLLNNSALS